MPRIKQRRFHVYDGKTLTYSGIGYERPLTAEEEEAIPNGKPRDEDYEIATWIDGPLAGQEGIVFVNGDNWIPAWWHRG